MMPMFSGDTPPHLRLRLANRRDAGLRQNVWRNGGDDSSVVLGLDSALLNTSINAPIIFQRAILLHWSANITKT